jgi:hypothetical protein
MLPTPGLMITQDRYAWKLTGEIRSPVRGKVIGVDKTANGYTVTLLVFNRYVFAFRGLEDVKVQPFEEVRSGRPLGVGDEVEYCVFFRGKGDPLFLKPRPGVAVPLEILHPVEVM